MTKTNVEAGRSYLLLKEHHPLQLLFAIFKPENAYKSAAMEYIQNVTCSSKLCNKSHPMDKSFILHLPGINSMYRQLKVSD